MEVEGPLRISIVTASFNQAPFIAEAIESVFQQKWDSLEYLIMDNCSTDGTLDILKNYPYLKVLREPDKGQSDALNKGFRMASGDIIGWLNADDRYLPGCFKHVAQFFSEHPATDVLYGDYRLVDVNGNVLQIRKEPPFDLFTLKYHHVLSISSTTCFFRRRIFDEGNFLNISYHYAMDHEFFLRLALKGYRFVHTPFLMADFRWHIDAKSSRQTVLQKQEHEQALMNLDDFLRGIPAVLRQIIRLIFMIFSCFKRLIQKLFL